MNSVLSLVPENFLTPQQNSFLKGRGLPQAIVCANYYAKFDGSPIANKWVKGGLGLARLHGSKTFVPSSRIEKENLIKIANCKFQTLM